MGILQRESFHDVVMVTAAFRALQMAILALCPVQFDKSTAILLQSHMVNRESRYPDFVSHFLEKLMSWDSVYFLKLSLGGTDYEHEWVFSPLWWRLLSIFKIAWTDLDIYDMALIGFVINNIALALTAIVLYKLAFHIGKNEIYVANPSKFAFTSALLLTFQPSGIFSIAGYSESVSQLLCYVAVYFRQISLGQYRIRRKNIYEISGLLFSLAFGFRSNCLLYGILYIFDLIKYPYYRSKLTSLMTGNVLFLSLLYSIWVPYKKYCPERGEWCNSLSKSLVSYAQSYYWGNGFLTYYTPNNIPNFLFALPQMAILALSLVVFSNWRSIRGELIVTGVYLVVQMTLMHVQIINRVSTFLPIHLLYVSHLLTRGKALGQIILFWWCFWALLQTALFAAFLPPA